MSRHLDCRGCFLISTIRSFGESPPWMRRLAPCAYVLPPRSDVLLSAAATAISWTVGPMLPAIGKQFFAHVSRFREPNFSWGCRAMGAWKPELPLTCPVYQIHGADDRVLPAEMSQASEIVLGGGHFLPRTQPAAINDFLFRHLSDSVLNRDSHPNGEEPRKTVAPSCSERCSQ
jgi:pimeloyl-ACP methyl ester carboxylesterase